MTLGDKKSNIGVMHNLASRLLFYFDKGQNQDTVMG